MNDLSRLDQQIREKLAAVEKRLQIRQQHTRQRMEEIDQSYRRFNQIADHVADELIRPRMEQLASHFDNAESESTGDPIHRHHYRYRFQHDDRFPATVTLDLAVCPDAQIENILVVYTLEILPILFHFEAKDQIAFPLDKVDEAQLIDWIERKIVDFVDTYLRLAETDRYQSENLVTDPVCGMRISKLWAAAELDYQGETYYFCIDECRAKFAEDPSRYVKRS